MIANQDRPDCPSSLPSNTARRQPSVAAVLPPRKEAPRAEAPRAEAPRALPPEVHAEVVVEPPVVRLEVLLQPKPGSRVHLLFVATLVDLGALVLLFVGFVAGF